jgi:hypothetical protein
MSTLRKIEVGSRISFLATLFVVGVANADPKGAWVDCDDLNNKTTNGKEFDDLHYTQEVTRFLGSATPGRLGH